MGWAEIEEETPAAEVQQNPPPAAVQANNTPAVQSANAASVQKTEVAVVPAKLTAFDCNLVKMGIAADGAVRSISFNDYKNSDLKSDVTIDADGLPGLFALAIPGFTQKSDFSIVRNSDRELTVSYVAASAQGKVKVIQTFSNSGNYIVNCRYTLCNLSKSNVSLNGILVSGAPVSPWHTLSGDKIRAKSHRMDIYKADGSFEDIDADDDQEDFLLNPPPQVLWAASGNKYFCSILKSNMPFTLFQERRFFDDNAGNEQPIIAAGARLGAVNLPANGSSSFEFSAYTGPKIVDNLSAFVPNGEKVMHLAWGPLNYLARFLLWALTLLHGLCGSYGWSIVILTLIVRSVFYPITAKGNESMKKMQKVQPLFKELREKYKDNPQLLNQKMSELYRKEGVNPFAGCFPILLQIPIFFALYAMLDNAIDLRHVSFLWCKNLAAADTVLQIPLFIDFPMIGKYLPLNPLVLAMTALMVIQQRMTPMSMDPAQKKMMAFMPVIMLVFLYDLPSGLTLYWTVSNLFSIIQLWLQKRRSQPPAAAAGAK